MAQLHRLGGTLLIGMAVGCGGSSAPQPPRATAPAVTDVTPVSKSQVDAGDAEESAIGKLLAQAPPRDFGERLRVVNDWIGRHPTRAAGYACRASVYIAAGKSQSAVADLDKAVELAPQSARYRNNRGFILFALGQQELARVDFDEAIRLDPAYSRPYNQRGLFHLARQDFEKAVADFDRALSLDSKYVDAWNNRGYLYSRRGQADRALADLNRALEIDSDYVPALANRGLVKFGLGDDEGSLLDFTAAMMKDPENPKYYEHRRQVYLRQGDLKKAQADGAKVALLQERRRLTAAVQAAPNQPAPYLNRARALEAQDRLADALADLDAALSIDPEHVEARLERGRLYVKTGEYAKATADCRFLLAKGNRPEAHSILGDCQLAQGRIDEALQSFEQARRLDEAVATAYLKKAELLAQAGDSTGAAQYRERAAGLNSSAVPEDVK